MSLVIFGPDEQWPRHQKSYWNDALDAARAHGWSYHYLGADHKSGDLVCPAGQHVLKVDKTSDGSSYFASRAKKIITSRCPDGNGGGPSGRVKERIEAADRHLGTAEALIATAGADLTVIESQAAGVLRLDELERLRTRLDTADVTLAELEMLEEAALEDALLQTPETSSVSEALDQAEGDLSSAAAVLGMVRKHGSLRELGRRMTGARAQVDELRARLEEFLPEVD